MSSVVLDDLDKRLLCMLQEGFPLTSRPYAILGHRLRITEEDTLTRVDNLYKENVIRQISAIFDTKRLGYDSCLAAMQIPADRLDEAAMVINKHPGVSHNYARSNLFNLWFTIATPPGRDLESDVRKLSEMVNAKATLLLPSLRMFKIGVKLDVEGAKDPLSTEAETPSYANEKPLPPLTDKEIAAVRELQEDLPVKMAPFKGMADRLGVKEEELFRVAQGFIDQGRMRRFAAVLRHRNAGFKANAMGTWVVPPKDVDRAGPQLAAFQAVSHCYQRPAYPPLWPYNLFTMVHARSKEECLDILYGMSRKVGIRDYDYLFSEKEYKKKRVRYFV